MNKAVAQQKELICALADKLFARTEEHRARGGAPIESERDVLNKARLAGWKPLLERGKRV